MSIVNFEQAKISWVCSLFLVKMANFLHMFALLVLVARFIKLLVVMIFPAPISPVKNHKNQKDIIVGQIDMVAWYQCRVRLKLEIRSTVHVFQDRMVLLLDVVWITVMKKNVKRSHGSLLEVGRTTTNVGFMTQQR